MSNQEIFSQGGAGLVANTPQTTCHEYSRADGFNMVLQPLAFKVRGGCDGGGKGYLGSEDCAFTLSTGVDQHIAQPMTYDMSQVTSPTNKQNRKPGDPCHTPAKEKASRATVVQPMAFKVRGGWEGGGKGYLGSEDCAFTLSTGVDQHIAQPIGIIGGQHPNASMDENISPTLTNAMGAGGGHVPLINASMAVRRLTPKECERLQGFPDSYTAIPWKNKPADQCPDGPRYKALGNSMAVPVMRWIGERIQAVEELMKEIKQ